eukprot:m.340090 g.340090  ORF g.340090 m.340090 type:complete len:137 (+) comp19129_c0_seq1:225-635(+)
MRVHGLAVLLLIASLQTGVISDTTTVIPTRNADDCPVYPDTITKRHDGCKCEELEPGQYTHAACEGRCCVKGLCQSGIQCVESLLIWISIAVGVILCCCAGLLGFFFVCKPHGAADNPYHLQQDPSTSTESYAAFR